MSEYWYPFFPEEYRKATRHLTAEQDGIYRRLIDEYMLTREPLPDDDISLARIAGVSDIKWLDAKRMVIAYFTHKNGFYSHKFCDNQLDVQDKRSKRRSLSAEKAAKKRWKNHKPKQRLKCDRYASPMRGDATVTDTSTDTERKKVYTSEFENFWKSWIPYKTGKGSKSEAFKFYKKSAKEISHEKIIECSRQYCQFCQSTDCNTKNVFRWLDKRGWEDDYEIPAKGHTSANGKESYSSQILTASERAREQLRLREEMGPDAEDGNARFDDDGIEHHSLLPSPSDIGPDTIPFRPLGDAQEDGWE